MRLWLEHLDDFTLAGVVEDIPSLLRAVELLAPEILLLDWALPGLADRAEQQQLLQQLYALRPELHVVALSTNPVNRQQAASNHLAAFVSKSEPPEYLAEVLRRLHQLIDAGK